jgi:multidrug efflux system membrane fusion protein
LRVRSLQNVIVIPSAAVQRASFGTFVYAVKPDSKVTIKRLTLGPAEGDTVSVASGLEGSERIVLEGVDELTEGAKVEVVTGDGTPSRPAVAATGPGSAAGGARQGGGR